MHRIYCGSTGSGKTYKAIHAAAAAVEKNQRVIVFNPLQQLFPKAAHRFGKPENFYAAATKKHKTKSLIIVDEIPILLAHDKDKFNHFISHARHFGTVIMLVQRPRVILSATLLSQCNSIVLFHLSLPADRNYIEQSTGILASEQEQLNKEKYEYFFKEF